jgi:hypothetical protein
MTTFYLRSMPAHYVRHSLLWVSVGEGITRRARGRAGSLGAYITPAIPIALRHALTWPKCDIT